MSMGIAPWNPLQFLVICSYTAFASFFLPPEKGLSVVSVFVCLAILCVPALFVQLKLGGYLQKGIVGIFSMFFPIWKGVGIAALLDLLLRIASFAPLVAQYGTYAFIAISDQSYVWGKCSELRLYRPSDNKQECWDNIVGDGILGEAMSDSKGGDIHRPEELFYKHEFLQLSGGPSNIDGFPQWRFTEIARKAEVSLMPVTLAIVWVLVFLLVGFGGRVCGWMLFLLGPAAISCLLAVLGYGYTNLNTRSAVVFLEKHYTAHIKNKEQFLEEWTAGFQVLMYSVPVWTAIAATMGKMCGRGRKIRNVSWLLLVVVYAVFSQLPPITMAPYIANMVNNNYPNVAYTQGPELLLWQMPAAFTTLDVPPVYACIFFISVFLFSLMFLCVGCLTIVDNIVCALEGWIERKACSKVAVHLLITFFIMCITLALGMIQTTRAGMYYSLLLDQSMFKLRFIYIILIALGFLVVYVKQNFALLERVLMAFWLGSSALICAAMWFYFFISEDSDSGEAYAGRSKMGDPKHHDHGFIYLKMDVEQLSDNWDIVRWVIAVFPFIGIPIGAIHACYRACGSGSPVWTKLCCGITERVREQNFDNLPPPPPPEPTAPPYMYTYMDNAYPLDEVTYKMEYDPPEAEPLRPHNSSTRI